LWHCIMNASASNGWCNANEPADSSQGTTATASPANDDIVIVDRITASCVIRLSKRTPSPPAISSAWLRATGTRPSALISQVTTARCARTLGLERGQRIEPLRGVKIVERDDPIRDAAAKAADVTDRENLRGDVHGEVEMAGRTDPAGDDQRACAHAVERRHHLGAPPQQRQRHGDQSGAQ